MNYSKYLKISIGMFVMLMFMMVVPKSGYAASLAAPEGLTQIAASTTSASRVVTGILLRLTRAKARPIPSIPRMKICTTSGSITTG